MAPRREKPCHGGCPELVSHTLRPADTDLVELGCTCVPRLDETQDAAEGSFLAADNRAKAACVGTLTRGGDLTGSTVFGISGNNSTGGRLRRANAADGGLSRIMSLRRVSHARSRSK